MKHPILHVPLAARKQVTTALYKAGMRRAFCFNLDQTVAVMEQTSDWWDCIALEGNRIIMAHSDYSREEYVQMNSVEQMIRYVHTAALKDEPPF